MCGAVLVVRKGRRGLAPDLGVLPNRLVSNLISTLSSME